MRLLLEVGIPAEQFVVREQEHSWLPRVEAECPNSRAGRGYSSTWEEQWNET